MNVRVLLADETPMLTALAPIHEEIVRFGPFDPARFVTFWTQVIQQEHGAIFALFNDKNELVGGLGFVQMQDMYSRQMIFHEAFWAVLKPYRGRGYGLRLLELFEGYGQTKGARIVMPAPATSDGAVLATQYVQRGYRASETFFVKEVALCPES